MREHIDPATQTVRLPEEPELHLRRDAAENRSRILSEARRLFQERGVEAVSMRYIAQASGVGQGTLYRRYAHKGELCQDLLAESVQRALSEIEAYLVEAGSETPPLDRLTGVLTLMVAFIEEKLLYLAAIRDACAGERRLSRYQSSWYCSLHAIVSRLLAESNGDAGSEADATFTADAILAALCPDLYQFQRLERGFSAEQIVHGVQALYLKR